MARAPPADSPVRPCDADLSCIAAPAVLESLDVLCGTSWLAANPPPTSTTAAAAAAIRGRRLPALGADSSGTTAGGARGCSSASGVGGRARLLGGVGAGCWVGHCGGLRAGQGTPGEVPQGGLDALDDLCRHRSRI